MMKKTSLYFITAVILMVAAGGGLSYYFIQESYKLSGADTDFSVQPQNKNQLSYIKVIYNFLGVVLDKEEGSLLVEGAAPDSGRNPAKPQPRKVRFIISPDLEVIEFVQADSGVKEELADFAAVQVGDRVALKAGGLDSDTEEAIATDILIIERNQQ